MLTMLRPTASKITSSHSSSVLMVMNPDAGFGYTANVAAWYSSTASKPSPKTFTLVISQVEAAEADDVYMNAKYSELELMLFNCYSPDSCHS